MLFKRMRQYAHLGHLVLMRRLRIHGSWLVKAAETSYSIGF
jgi:hypothetical protein